MKPVNTTRPVSCVATTIALCLVSASAALASPVFSRGSSFSKSVGGEWAGATVYGEARAYRQTEDMWEDAWTTSPKQMYAKVNGGLTVNILKQRWNILDTQGIAYAAEHESYAQIVVGCKNKMFGIDVPIYYRTGRRAYVEFARVFPYYLVGCHIGYKLGPLSVGVSASVSANLSYFIRYGVDIDGVFAKGGMNFYIDGDATAGIDLVLASVSLTARLRMIETDVASNIDIEWTRTPSLSARVTMVPLHFFLRLCGEVAGWGGCATLIDWPAQAVEVKVLI